MTKVRFLKFRLRLKKKVVKKDYICREQLIHYFVLIRIIIIICQIIQEEIFLKLLLWQDLVL